MPSKLEQLKAMTTVVADTGDMDAIRRFGVADATTNPTLILKAARMPNYAHLLEEAVLWGLSHHHSTSEVADHLILKFGFELSKTVPGRISTEADADLSFDIEGTVAKAREIIAGYKKLGLGHKRILIKIASTWEGIRAAEILQAEGIDCNMTLLFSLTQAAACADAGAFLISPFVGRILDWYTKHEGKTYTAETDPGVLSVRQIYNYYKAHGIETEVMGASFRNKGEIEALAGCDRLTISPQLLEELSADMGELPRRLDPKRAAAHAPARLSLDEKTFRFMLNEDAMATEKLAEGIRVFAQDLHALRELVSKRLQEAA
ncbi:MAG: transaldolase [Beijerinckiaceae bacterium]|nr:transaldolase [Beijerinckiaceae bacterium]